MSDLEKAILEIAKQNSKKGFTVKIPDLEPVEVGWCIGMKETQNCHGIKGLRKAIQVSLETTKVVGGWRGYNGKYYFDAVIIEMDPMVAVELKYLNNQLSIYNIETGKTL